MLRRHAAGFNPRDLAGGRRHRRARCRRARRRRSAGRRGTVGSARTCSATSSTSPAAPGRARRCGLGRQPARHDGAAGRGQGVGLAERVRRGHPGPRAGDGAAGVAAPHPAAPGGRARGRRAPTRSCARSCSRCRCRSSMAVSGMVRRARRARRRAGHRARHGHRRAAARARARGCCSCVAARRRRPAARRLAAPARAVSGRCPARVRLGETVTSDAVPDQHRAARTVRGIVRDAWQPSAGRRHRPAAVSSIPPGERRAVATHADPVPPRRAPGRPGHGAVVRAAAACRRGRRRSTRPGASGCCRRSTRASTCRRGWPGCGNSTARTSVMVRGQGTEFDSLREYVRGDDVRSIDWRATARDGSDVVGAHLAARARPPGRDRHRHRPHLRGPHRGRDRASTPRSSRRCCWPRSRPGPATGSTSSSTTGGCAGGCRARPGADLLSRRWWTRWRRSTRNCIEMDWTRRARPGALGDEPALARRAAHLDRRARRVRGAARRCCRS